jgi:hypothetical protein
MGILVRALNASDYDDILVGWWKDWGLDAPTRDFLPDDATGGLIVFDGNEPVCAGFMYTMNAKVAWVEWIVSSKTYRKKPMRKDCLELLIHTLTHVCKSKGAKYVFSNNNNKHLIESFINSGYVKGCTNSTELIKIL